MEQSAKQLLAKNIVDIDEVNKKIEMEAMSFGS
jgi:hypothetical protein